MTPREGTTTATPQTGGLDRPNSAAAADASPSTRSSMPGREGGGAAGPGVRSGGGLLEGVGVAAGARAGAGGAKSVANGRVRPPPAASFSPRVPPDPAAAVGGAAVVRPR